MSALIDDFNRASLGSDWTVLAGAFQLSSNRVLQSGGASDNLAYYNVELLADAACEVTIVTNATGDSCGIALLTSSDPLNGYLWVFTKSSGTDTHVIYRLTNGSPTSLSSASYEVANDSILRIEKVGNTISIYDDSNLIDSATDSTYSAPFYGGIYFNGTGPSFDDFSGNLASLDINLTDSISCSDDSSIDYDIELPDTFTISEVELIGFSLSVTDTMGITEVLDFSDGLVPLTDDFSISEELLIELDINLSDSFVLSDVLEVLIPQDNITDSMAITEILLVTVEVTISEDISLSENEGVSATVGLPDSMAITDEPSLEIVYSQTDSIAISEDLVVSSDTEVYLNDDLSFYDNVHTKIVVPDDLLRSVKSICKIDVIR